MVEFEREFRAPEAFRGLEGFSHLLAAVALYPAGQGWSPTVRPPRLGGNQRVGVFATRSPFRPNPIGLSCVQLEKVDYTAPGGACAAWCGAPTCWTARPSSTSSPTSPWRTAVPRRWGAFRTSTGRTAFPWTSRRRCWSRCRRKAGGPVGRAGPGPQALLPARPPACVRHGLCRAGGSLHRGGQYPNGTGDRGKRINPLAGRPQWAPRFFAPVSDGLRGANMVP